MEKGSGESSFFKISLELEGEKRISGNNMFQVLERIKKQGSISHAASSLGFSYRYAWGLIREAEKALGKQLVEKQAGGSAGGGTRLTQEGEDLLFQYQNLKEEMDRELKRFLSGEKKEANSQNTEDSGEEELAERKTAASVGRYLLLASTMEPVESGLLDLLEQAFYRRSGVLVRHIAVGSGRALDLAREGRVDMTLTHAPELEENFLQEGLGLRKMPLMSNAFILVGPADLEGWEEERSVTGIFRRLAESQLTFISRGDDSGTHQREKKIWEKAGINPDGEWYLVSPGVAGNLGLLQLAVEKKAFTLVDRASFMLFSRREELRVFAHRQEEKNAELFNNVFTLLQVNPEQFKTVNHEDAAGFMEWLRGEGREMIAGFGCEKYGEPLFFPLD